MTGAAIFVYDLFKMADILTDRQPLKKKSRPRCSRQLGQIEELVHLDISVPIGKTFSVHQQLKGTVSIRHGSYKADCQEVHWR